MLLRILEALPGRAVIVKAPTWDIVVWNAAAAAVLTDYAALLVRERNVLRLLSRDAIHANRLDRRENARFAIGVL